MVSSIIGISEQLTRRPLDRSRSSHYRGRRVRDAETCPRREYSRGVRRPRVFVPAARWFIPLQPLPRDTELLWRAEPASPRKEPGDRGSVGAATIQSWRRREQDQSAGRGGDGITACAARSRGIGSQLILGKGLPSSAVPKRELVVSSTARILIPFAASKEV